MYKYAEQWNDIAGTDKANNAIATKDWEEEPYFCLSGIKSCSNLLNELLPIYGKELHKKVFLELGCGTGRETRYYTEVFDTIYGVDVSENMIEKAKKRVSGATLLVCDGETLPVPDNSIDIVYSFIVLQHCPKDIVLSYFKEVKRVLRKGGVFVFQIHIGEQHQEQQDYLSYSTWTKQEVQAGLEGLKEVKFLDNNQMELIIYAN